jgi:hypothetical protein
MTKRGSANSGPSKAYLRLLHGRSTPEEYVQQVRRAVEREATRNTQKRAAG